MSGDQTLSPADLDLIATAIARLSKTTTRSDLLRFNGTVSRVRHLDRKTGFSVFDVLSDGSDIVHVVTGTTSRHLGPGMRAVVKGTWQYH